MVNPNAVLFSLISAEFKQVGDADWTHIDWATSADYVEADPIYARDEDYCGRVRVVASKTDLRVLARLTSCDVAHTPRSTSLPIQPSRQRDAGVPHFSLRLKSRAVDNDVTSLYGEVVLYNAQCFLPFKQLIKFANGRVSEMTLDFSCFLSDHDENGNPLSVPAAGRFSIYDRETPPGVIMIDDMTNIQPVNEE